MLFEKLNKCSWMGEAREKWETRRESYLGSLKQRVRWGYLGKTEG